MAKFSGTITLTLNEFFADNEEQANEMVDSYIDNLAKNVGMVWDTVDTKIGWAD